MVQPSSQVALAVFGLLVVGAVGALVLPDGQFDVERHQVPQLPGATSVVSEPIHMDGNPLTGQATMVRIVSPADPGITLVRLEVGPAATTIHVLGDEVLRRDGVTSPILVTGDVLTDDVVRFTVVGPAASYWVEVDRSTQPATIRMSPTLTAMASDTPLPTTIQAPVAFAGEHANPTFLAVYNVAESPPTVVFSYVDNGDGTSTLRWLDPTKEGTQYNETTVPLEQLRIEGSPLDDEVTFTIQPTAAGTGETRFALPLGDVRTQLAAAGVEPGPHLVVVEDAAFRFPSYKAATDGERTLDPERLDGRHWLNGNRPGTIMVDVQKERDLSAPRLLLDVQTPTAGAPTTRGVDMQRGAEANGFVRYQATVPQDWLSQLRDGQAVHFSIAYRTVVAKLVAQQLVDDNEGAGYRFLVDKGAPSVPTVLAESRDAASPTQLLVSWRATDPGSGLATYTVQRSLSRGAEQGPWEDWVVATETQQAEFTGKLGFVYRFRARATDLVGNQGEWGTSAPVSFAPEATETENRAPTVQILQPVGGERFAGVGQVTVKWRASDADGTTPVINLFWSSDGGTTWKPLASPRGTEHVWDVSRLAAGTDYRVKVEATDGSLANQDVSGRFTIDTTGLATADTIGGPNAQSGLPGPGQPGDGGTGTQAPGEVEAGSLTLFLLIGALLLVAAVGVGVWQWRSRNRFR